MGPKGSWGTGCCQVKKGRELARCYETPLLHYLVCFLQLLTQDCIKPQTVGVQVPICLSLESSAHFQLLFQDTGGEEGVRGGVKLGFDLQFYCQASYQVMTWSHNPKRGIQDPLSTVSSTHERGP